ncbi:MAG: hypothetical protein PHH83_02155 [Patescibacteria group bacterium]|nr:hypothetical protein [Patescibacteria group bacterium]
MDKKIPNTQMPTNQESLIHMSFFISYCKNNGLNIDKSTLEELHKYELVFPALKVYLGIVEYRKIYAIFNGKEGWAFVHPEDLKKFKVIKQEKNKYYSVGSLSKFNDHWLDYYFNNNMIEMPSQNKFSSWKQKQFPDFCLKINEMNKQYEFVYDKKQILAIKIALPNLKLIKSNNIDSRSKNIIKKSIQQKISNLYKFFELYHEMEKLYDLFTEAKKNKFLEYKKEIEKKPTKIELNQEYEFDIFPKFNKLAKNILAKYSLDKEFICDWREFLSEKSLINESGRSNEIKMNYIKALSDKEIVNLEDVHYMIYITNVFLYLLSGKQETLKQVLGNLTCKICPICGSGFKPRNKEQITCGSNQCIKEHKNQLKKDARKINNMKKLG